MKLGIAMLLIGLLFAGFGFFLWNFAGSAWLWTTSWFSSWEEQSMAKAIGMGVTVFGGGLSVGGIVRMIVKR
jgi:hypothetical protein